ncbi:MAG: hypothetical protein AB7O24_17480 [Kofleriaceae bacterium]
MALEPITEGGAGFQSIRAKRTLEERNLRLLDHDLTWVKTEIDRVAGEPIDAAQLRHVLGDFDTLFTVANTDEREELLKLLIKRIGFRGPEAEVTMELSAGINVPGAGPKFRASWLPRTLESRTLGVVAKFPKPVPRPTKPQPRTPSPRRGDEYRDARRPLTPRCAH